MISGLSTRSIWGSQISSPQKLQRKLINWDFENFFRFLYQSTLNETNRKEETYDHRWIDS